MKKTIAKFLIVLTIFSYSSPLIAQVNSGSYEVYPPVSTNTDNTTVPMPDTYSNNYNSQSTIPPLQAHVVTAPRGTSFEVVMNSTINSISSRLGDTISGTLEEPLIIDSKTVFPSGTEMRGQITFIESSGRVGKNASMDIRFTSAKLPTGERVPLNAKIITTDSSGVLYGGKKSNIVLKAAGTTVATTAVGAAAGAGTGAILGSVAGGALFGTAVGGLAGIGYAIYRKGKDIVLPSGTRLGLTLEQPLTVTSAK